MKRFLIVAAGAASLVLCTIAASAQTPEQQEAELQAILDRCTETSRAKTPAQAIQACTKSVVFFQSNPLPGPNSVRRNLDRLNESLRVRGKLYFVVGEYSRAIDDFNGVIGHPVDEDDRKSSLIDRGFSYLAQGLDANAIQDFSQSLAIIAGTPDMMPAYALYGRGLAQRHKGDRALGDSDIAMAAQLYPQIGESVAAEFPYNPR